MVKSSKKGLKEYKLITHEENKALELKNQTLIERVSNTEVFNDEAKEAIKKRNEAKRMEDEWAAYLACDPLPKPFEPQNIREFFCQVFNLEQVDIENTVNWTLGIDERSLLTQDFSLPDLSQRHLKLSKPILGDKYNDWVNDAMVIARRIEDFLEEPTVELSKRILHDVEELKFVAYKQMRLYMDNLTYRVLCSEDAYMDPIDVTTAEYSYQGKLFRINIWTFKNVPIYLHPIETPSKLIKMSEIKVDLVLPFSVLCENMTIRGLHCKFDNFSPNARFNVLPHTEVSKQNLSVCLKNEWESQMKIQAEVTERLRKRRADFEEAMQLKAQEEEKMKLERKKKEEPPKPHKKEKPVKEPQTVGPDVVPDVRADFLTFNTREYEDMIMQFHPEKFEFTRGEVNLRKYQILGGVYQISTLFKSKNLNLPKLIMTWYRAEQTAQTTDIHVQVDATTDVVKFFQVTFELPECFCLWGEPTACLFEEGESYRVDNLPDATEGAKVLTEITPVIMNDFNLHQLFTRPLMYDFLASTIPRIISSFKFPNDLLAEGETKKPKATLTHQTAEARELEEELLMKKQLYSYEAQNAPERLFPLFKKTLPVVILPIQEKNTPDRGHHPYQYFSEFYSVISSITEAYRATKFKDKQGKPLKILAEKYESNIRHPLKKISKTVLYEEEHVTETHVSLILTPEHSTESMKSLRTKETHEHHGGKKQKRKHHKRMSLTEEKPVKEEREPETRFSKWSTANILKSEFDRATRKVTLWTDRLGVFGFAYYRYQHFPFQNWSLQPNDENPDEVEFTIESEHAIFRFYISVNGYRVNVTDFTQYAKKRKVYLEITEPITDIKLLREALQDKHLNVFPEQDAVWYVTGYFAEKHLSAELHTYSCMSLYATSLKFRHCIWNKLSTRRIMVLKFGELRDLEEDFFLIAVHPEEVKFVDIKELCTADLNQIQLEYKPTWRNFEWYPDLNHLVMSTYVHWSAMRTKEPNVVYYLKSLLEAIRPLSYS